MSLLSQFVSKGCLENVKKQYIAGRIDTDSKEWKKIIKSRNKKCANKEATTGWDIGEFSPEQLVQYKEDGKTYCFTAQDLHKLELSKPKNPYTKKPIPPEELKFFLEHRKVAPLSIPLTFQLMQEDPHKLICPYFPTSDPETIYYYSTNPLDISDLEFDVLASYNMGIRSPKPETSIYIGYLYKITLKSSKKPVTLSDVKSFELIHRAKEWESSPRPPAIEKLPYSLKNTQTIELFMIL